VKRRANRGLGDNTDNHSAVRILQKKTEEMRDTHKRNTNIVQQTIQCLVRPNTTYAPGESMQPQIGRFGLHQVRLIL